MSAHPIPAEAPHKPPSAPLLALLVALPLVAVAAALWHTFVDLPMLDDYNATLNFLLRQQHLPTFSARLILAVTEQQAEYKFILLHLLLLAQQTLFGHLSLAPLAITGDLLLLPLLFVLCSNAIPAHTTTSRRHRLALTLPVLYLACQLTYAELFNWALASWNALAVVTLGALALHLLIHHTSGPRSTLLACLCLMLACAASTNAFLLAPIGLLLLLRERRLRASAAWSLATLLALALYLFGLHPVPHAAPPPLLDRLLFLLSFLGGAIEDMHRNPVRGAAILLGTLLLLLVADAFRTGFLRRNPFFVALATWVILSAAAVSNFRSSIGLFQSLSSRYKLYSTLLLVFAYVYLADRIRNAPTVTPARRRALYLAALGMAILFNIGGIVTGEQFLLRRQQTVQRGMRAYLADPAHNSPLGNQGAETWSQAESDFERQSLTAAIAAGLYTPPPH